MFYFGILSCIFVCPVCCLLGLSSYYHAYVKSSIDFALKIVVFSTTFVFLSL